MQLCGALKQQPVRNESDKLAVGGLIVLAVNIIAEYFVDVVDEIGRAHV